LQPNLLSGTRTQEHTGVVAALNLRARLHPATSTRTTSVTEVLSPS